MTSPGAALPGLSTVIAGRYEIVGVRGTGMMGVVYEAVDRTTSVRVALKVLRPEAALVPQVAERLSQEGKIVRTLKSPHVVRVLDVGATAEGLPYIAMELLEGRDLMAAMESRSIASVGEAVRIVRQACEGLAEAHAMGVIHRDLKPQNLFLARVPGGPDCVKLLDFGVSKVVGSNAALTSTEATLGTPLYMAPEHIRSARDVDERSDVWALGIVLFELLAKRPPFHGESGHAVAASIVADAPLRLRDVVPGAPEGLDALLARVLEKDPSRRIQSALELCELLAPFDPTYQPSRAIDNERTIVEMPALLPEQAPAPAAARPMPVPAPARMPVPVPSAAPMPVAASAPPLSPGREEPAPKPARRGIGKIVFAIVFGLAAAAALAFLIHAGLKKRRSARHTVASAHGSASASAKPVVPSGVTFADAVAAASASGDGKDAACLLPHPDRPALGALLPGASVDARGPDLEARLRSSHPARTVLHTSPFATGGPDEVVLEPLTPAFPIASGATIVVVVVTSRSTYVGLLRDASYEDIGAASAREKFAKTLAPHVDGFVVAADARAPVERVEEAIRLLSDVRSPVVLAAPLAAAPPDSEREPCATQWSGPYAPRALAQAEWDAVSTDIRSIAARCSGVSTALGGQTVRVMLRPSRGSNPLATCIQATGRVPDDVRTCILDGARALDPKLASAGGTALFFDVALTGPRVAPVCAGG